jgi:virulence factor Mce-like protein
MTRRTVATALALVGAAGVLAGLAGFLTRGPSGEHVIAEFSSARGLVVGADVRVGGGIAGRVSSISLTGDGRARVQLALNGSMRPPRADATAAIRPVDLLGDVYVDLWTGRAARPLRGAIPVARTSNAPRLDEVLAAFDEPVRTALGLVLAESGRSLGAHGEDLGRAAIELRPALQASDAALRELSSRNAQLERLVAGAERASGGLAARADDVQGLVSGLQRTLSVTAGRSADLRRGLAGLPDTLKRVRGTASALAGTARAARPLAQDLRATAPSLAGALRELRPFLVRLRDAAGVLRPTLAAARTTLTAGAPALRALDDALGRLGGIAPAVDRLSAAVAPAAPKISEGFFVNFADQGAEPGKQPFDPFADPRRNYWRGAAVFSCEAFGVPVAPGCLDKVLAEQGQTRAPAGPPAAAPTASTLLDYLLGR